MKRLPFALVALALSVPAVACLNSGSEDDEGLSVDNLDEAMKTACNFGFTAVATPTDAPMKLGPKSEVVAGKRVAVGNFAKDQNVDLVVASDTTKIQLFVGQGDGTFKSVDEKAINGGFPGRTRVALTTAAVGDFDGDGYKDIMLAITSIPKGDNPDPADVQVNYKLVNGTRDEKLALSGQVFPALKEKVLFHTTGDLDGDGADDLVIVTAKGQSVIFGEKGNRKMTPGDALEYANTSDRVQAFITPKTADKPAALVLMTADGKVGSLTFDGARKAKPSEVPLSGFDKKAWPVAADLDQDGTTEISMLSDKLSIAALGSDAAPLTFDGVAGRTITALDFDANGKSELVYAVADETKLYAACGYEPGAKAIAAVELPVAYDRTTFIAGSADFNNDGKADLLTLTNTDGALKVYLGGTRMDPPPALTVFSSSAAVGADAGSEGGAADTGTGTTADASVEASTDSGPTNPPVDAGSDSSAPTPDAGTPRPDSGAPRPDAGTPPRPDAGTVGPDQGDDDDDTEEPTDPPVDEESGPTKTKKPSTKPSTGGVTITPKPTPQSVDDGCSAAPGSHGPSTTAFGGLLAAMLLLGRRRNRKK